MAQTKRKRRTKHRGNAAGGIEARGRTSRNPKLSSAEQKKLAREERLNRPPTWKSAATKAAIMSLVLFVLTQVGLLGKGTAIGVSVFLSLAAFAIYTPLAYATDVWVYRRNQARQARKAGAKR